MEKELEQLRDATKAASAIAARATNLETELARLQHDSISDMRAAEETMSEAVELRKLLPKMESKSSNMEEWVNEKLSLQEALKKSEEREKSLELFVARLKEEPGVAEKVIRGLNQKVDTVNSGVNGNGVFGARNCDHTFHNSGTTNQQVHWVVQVIPYVTKGRSHGDCRLEASYGHPVNFSQADSNSYEY
ncbi:hypothetical protein Ahy_B08g092135 isoform A [Arachis hypogaea]|uniref:Uncharacterized protein n=1 Tax=Arachis hypogaea TaxID=3818 RepID=A0A444Y3A5_ARAHY|nr:hypothetical protein Ahy_B08g092135 isoform A [Arachis hypogaea]